MKYFIFRNYTIEPFFQTIEASFSGYEDMAFIDETADAYIWFYLSPIRANNADVAREIDHYSAMLDMVRHRLDPAKPFFVFSIKPIFNVCYRTSDHTLEDATDRYNRQIRQMAETRQNVKLIPISHFFDNFSAKELIDWKYYSLAQMPLNPKLANAFSQWFLRQVDIAGMRRKKCIVADLDNTLWGGILGEDGIDGIKMDGDYPGSAYRFFQQYLLELAQNGILLAICSKNNEADVGEVWEQHPALLVKKEHISAYKINWNDKASNIKEIAEKLNIGLESIVFIDDNPAEREWVRHTLPEVSVPDFPSQPYLYPEFAKTLTDNYFSTYRLTDEDLSKTQQYKQNAERQNFQSCFEDYDSYLRNLEIKLTIEPMDNFNIVRMAQMTQKTNQFNLTTHRYTETDLLSLAQKGAWIVGLRAKDRFGEYGMTGLAIMEINGNKAIIDTLLLSCRILGKKIEEDFLHHLLLKLKDKGISNVEATYCKTTKNAQTADFYDSMGFLATNHTEETTTYHLPLEEYKTETSTRYKIEEK